MSFPVFESLFEYESQEWSIEELEILHPRLVEAMDQPPKEFAERAFSKKIKPYLHQIKAWEHLKSDSPKSVIVATGTASGKTECFLIPILDDLVREYVDSGNRKLEGVRALFLYPLNALINSQRERLSAWTARFEDGVRFCLYNGATPHEPLPQRQQVLHEVQSRKQLYQCPPPILVTNATMLEYMLVRKTDEPILNASQGKLRWIVLDEAHTYLGSNAAEVSLLLRRVMEAFSVKAKDIRFVATSATIGKSDDPKACEKLREYLADLAGVSISQVEVVGGQRVTPELIEKISCNAELPTIEEIGALDSYQERYRRLASVAKLRELRERLTISEMRLDEIQEHLGTIDKASYTIQLLDACSEQPPKDFESQPLLPLRGHFFLRARAGTWACWNEKCNGRDDSLDLTWPFGTVFHDYHRVCPHCNSQVFEIVLCRDCGETYLSAQTVSRDALKPISCWDEITEDDFQLVDNGDDSDETSESSPNALEELICTGINNEFTSSPTKHDVVSGELVSSGRLVEVRVATRNDRGKLRCVRCGETSGKIDMQFTPLRSTGAFYLAATIPGLLEHMPEIIDKTLRPNNGRQLITFTDS
ncbi:MAG: DEAD/DEAH box helicase [Pirellula sp.]